MINLEQQAAVDEALARLSRHGWRQTLRGMVDAWLPRDPGVSGSHPGHAGPELASIGELASG